MIQYVLSVYSIRIVNRFFREQTHDDAEKHRQHNREFASALFQYSDGRHRRFNPRTDEDMTEGIQRGFLG